MAAARLLVVEDDQGIASNLKRALEGHGYEVALASDGPAAVAAAAVAMPDLVLLDLGLPGDDGVEVCRAFVERHPAVPVVILTVRDSEMDVVVGLDAGAVDYVTKPFRLAELLARIRAQLRRPSAGDARRIVVGDLTVDCGSRRAWVDGRTLELRAKEFELLAALAARAGNVLTREEAMSEVWDENWFGPTKTLDVHVATLRRKLGEQPGQRSRITTLRGVGYRLEANGQPPRSHEAMRS